MSECGPQTEIPGYRISALKEGRSGIMVAGRATRSVQPTNIYGNIAVKRLKPNANPILVPTINIVDPGETSKKQGPVGKAHSIIPYPTPLPSRIGTGKQISYRWRILKRPLSGTAGRGTRPQLD